MGNIILLCQSITRIHTNTTHKLYMFVFIFCHVSVINIDHYQVEFCSTFPFIPISHDGQCIWPKNMAENTNVYIWTILVVIVTIIILNLLTDCYYIYLSCTQKFSAHHHHHHHHHHHMHAHRYAHTHTLQSNKFVTEIYFHIFILSRK